MSKRAEERALEFYPMKDYNKEPNYIHSCDSKMLDEVYRQVFMLGYEQAEKDTIERAVAWLETNVWEYTGLDHTELSDAFRQAMEEQQ